MLAWKASRYRLLALSGGEAYLPPPRPPLSLTPLPLFTQAGLSRRQQLRMVNAADLNDPMAEGERWSGWCPAITARWINDGLTLVQRRRRWTNVKRTSCVYWDMRRGGGGLWSGADVWSAQSWSRWDKGLTAGLMLGQCCGQWQNSKPAFSQRLRFLIKWIRRCILIGLYILIFIKLKYFSVAFFFNSQ